MDLSSIICLSKIQGEEIFEGAVREVKEETGVRNPSSLFFIFFTRFKVTVRVSLVFSPSSLLLVPFSTYINKILFFAFKY